MRKKVILPLVVGVLLASASTVYALNNQTRPVSTHNTASHMAKNDSAQTTTAQSAQAQDTQPAPAPISTVPTVKTQIKATTATIQPTPEQNKVRIMAVITDYAQTKWGYSSVFYETNCFDRIFTQQNLYSSYDLLINNATVQKYLSGQLVFTSPSTCATEVPPAS